MKVLPKIVSVLILFELHALKAQDEAETGFQKNQFSLGVIAGVNQTRFQTKEIGEEIDDPYGLNYAMRFAYRYRWNHKLYMEGGLSIALQNEKIIPPNEEFDDDLNGVFRGIFFPNLRLDVLGVYEILSNSKTGINIIGGFGVTRFIENSVVSQYITPTANFEVNYLLKDQLIPFINVGSEFTLKNKRNDEFGFRILYNYGFSSFYDGTYKLWKNFQHSEGTLESLLRGINIGFNYTFTRSSKNSRLTELMNSNELTRKAAKKQNKFEKRAIATNSQYVSVSLGLGKIQNKFSTESETTSPRRSLTLMFGASYERGWKNNLFFEADYKFLNFRHGFRAQYTPESFGEWGGEAFASHFLNAGIQYKIQNPKTNFQFFNVHAGVGLGYQFKPKGEQVYESVGLVTNDISFNYSSNSKVRGNAMPVIYAGVSKDFRITEKFLLNLAYRQQFGFNNIYSTDYYYTTSIDPEIKTATSKINGSVLFLQMGLKYRIM